MPSSVIAHLAITHGLPVAKSLRYGASSRRDRIVAAGEAIHRQDLDVPDDLIAAAAELGCFGTCIPQRFGGLMPDERSDRMFTVMIQRHLQHCLDLNSSEFLHE